MRTLAWAVTAILLADATPRGYDDPDLPVEKLGKQFESKGHDEEHGLAVSIWRNVSLDREERWHSNDKGEWYLRARPGIFVLTEHEPEAGWVTRPLERLVWRDRAWRRITVGPKKKQP